MIKEFVERPKIDPDMVWDTVQKLIDDSQAERVAIIIETKNGGRITFEIDEALREKQDQSF